VRGIVLPGSSRSQIHAQPHNVCSAGRTESDRFCSQIWVDAEKIPVFDQIAKQPCLHAPSLDCELHTVHGAARRSDLARVAASDCTNLHLTQATKVDMQWMPPATFSAVLSR
jgi:hypothetical protein